MFILTYSLSGFMLIGLKPSNLYASICCCVSVSGAHSLLEPSGPEARARVFVHVLYEFRDY